MIFFVVWKYIKEELIYGNKLTTKNCNYQHMGEGFMYIFLLCFMYLCILICVVYGNLLNNNCFS